MVKKKKDYLAYSLLFQFLVCVLLFLSIIGLKKSNSDIYVLLKNDFYSNLNSDIFVPINENLKTDNSMNESVNNNVEAPATTESSSETTNEADENLSVNIKGETQNDYDTETLDEIPDNVSVNSYVLSQRMVVPVQGTISSEFGVRNHPISNDLKFHAGIDIAADSGTPIYSAFSGEIVTADYDEWNGYYLKIQHDGNIMTVYCHCKSLCVNEGDYVNAGDVVAYVGSTGSSTGPHLHFELRVNNVSYDPKAALDNGIDAV